MDIESKTIPTICTCYHPDGGAYEFTPTHSPRESAALLGIPLEELLDYLYGGCIQAHHVVADRPTGDGPPRLRITGAGLLATREWLRSREEREEEQETEQETETCLRVPGRAGGGK